MRYTRSLRLFSSLLLLFSGVQLSGLDANLSFARFMGPNQPYVEVILHVEGWSVAFEPVADAKHQAQIEVVITFSQSGKIVRYDKYLMKSPITPQPVDFVDLRRYALPEGKYQVDVTLTDLQRSNNTQSYAEDFQLYFPGQSVTQSDLVLLAGAKKSVETSTFDRHGYRLDPLVYNTYLPGSKQLIFYQEIYRTDQAIEGDFLVSAHIDRVANNGSSSRQLSIHKRRSAADIVPLILPIDIEALPNGDYELIVEVRTKEKALLNRERVAFKRGFPNDYRAPDLDWLKKGYFVENLDSAQLEYSLRALTVYLPQDDIEQVNRWLRTDSLMMQRAYLRVFWEQQSPKNPEAGYHKFMAVAEAVDQRFRSGFRFGFETDRGQIYLKYGPPNDIHAQEDEPSAPPYEIWSYNEIKRTAQNNARFVFYNPNLAPGDFVLLHSNVTGERNNPQWLRDLYRNAPADHGEDPLGGDVEDNFNRRAARIFRDN